MNRLLFLGVGAIAEAVRQHLPELPAHGTTRGPPDLRFGTISPIAAGDERAIRTAARDASVVVSFPPDGRTDRAFSAWLEEARSIVYLSSTAVYPLEAGTVTETTAVASSGDRALLRLAAEDIWLEQGASVLRLPAFYGPANGLHVSLERGSFRMPGRGDNVVSRVHVEDAARFVRAALNAPAQSLLLAGDDEPATVAEVVDFVCELFDLPSPPSIEVSAAPLSLRGSRSVDNRMTKTRWGITLAYPTYREGYRALRKALLSASRK